MFSHYAAKVTDGGVGTGSWALNPVAAAPWPPALAVITRPECDRGTVAAEQVLDEKIVARRDALKDGYLSCQWGTPTRSIGIQAGGAGSCPADTFATMKDTTGRDKADWPDRVNVGAEGWKLDDGYLAFRTSKQKYVVVAASQSIVVTHRSPSPSTPSPARSRRCSEADSPRPRPVKPQKLEEPAGAGWLRPVRCRGGSTGGSFDYLGYC